MKYDHFSMLPERAFQPRNGRTGMTLEGGGGGGGHTTSTVTQSNIPDWLRPQTEAVLGAGLQEYFQTEFNPETGGFDITGTKPYTPYSTDPRDYIAQFAPQQQRVFGEVAGMQTPGGFYEGAGMTGVAGMGGLGTAEQGYGYGGAGFESGQLGQQLGILGGQQYGGLGAGYGALGAGLAPQAQLYGAQGAGYGEAAAAMSPEARMYGGMGAGYGQQAAGLSPQAQMYGSRAAEIGEMGLNAETYGREIGDEARGFARQAAGMGDRYAQMATDPSSIQAYMSPYMQNVIEIQKQQAIEDAQRAQLGANLGAARQGTYGGARQTLAQAQREAGLTKQLSDIQARGLQDAFQQAQQAQQFGVTTGLQGLQGAQAGLGTALQGGQLGLSGIGQAMAGQQAGLQGLGQAGQLYGLGMQGAQAGLSGVDRAIAAQQAGMQGAQAGLAGLGRAGEMYGLGMQGAGLGLQGVQQQLAGTAQGMQGAGVGLSGVGAAQAGYGLTGQMGAQAANIAAAQQQADLARLGFQGQMGDIQQQQQQRIIDQAIQNFALAEEMPFQRLAGYNALLRGYATPTTTTSQYQAGPNALQSIGALGTAAGGFGSLMGGGKKAGGVIKYAEGGITDINALEGMAQDLSIPQIQQSMKNETLPKYVGMPILEQKVNEAERMKMAQAMMGQQQQQQSISDALMAKADQLQGITDEAVMAAGGGIVAFQSGGDVVKGALNISPDRFRNYIDMLRKQGVDPKTIQAIKQNPSLLSRIAPKIPVGGIAGAVAVPGMLATDALMSTDTGVGDEADVMFSGIEPGAGGPRTARNALEAGQQLFGALIPSGPGAETRAAQAEIDAQREAQNVPPVSDVYPDETQRGIVPGPTQPSKPGAGKGKPKDEISAALDGITSVGQDAGAPQQSLREFADQYLKERGEYAGEDVLSKKLKERSEKESSIFDRLSSAGAQIGLAGSMLRDPSRYGEYAQQAAGLRTAEAKARDEREMDYLKAMDRERQNKIAAFDKAEQRMSDEKKQSAQFKHEKELNNARIAVQKMDVSVRSLANQVAAKANALKEKRDQFESDEKFFYTRERDLRESIEKAKKLIIDDPYGVYGTTAEEKKVAIAGLEAQLALELDAIRKEAQRRMFPGMSFKNVTPAPGQ